MNSFDPQKENVEVTEEVTAAVANNEDVAAEEQPAASEEKPRKARRFSLKSNRKLRLGATATAFTALVAAAVVILNMVVGILYDRFPLTLDLTADRTFTMSDNSREVAKNIKNELEILVFLEESIFSAPATGYEELNTVLRQFYLFTQEYNSLSGGKVKTQYIDLESNPTLASAYKQYEVGSGSILFRCGEQYRVLDVTDLYSEEYDSSYNIIFSSLVEQKLATTVNAVCGGKVVNLTFLTGHGENESLIAVMQQVYENNGYTTDTLNLATAQEINTATGALVIAGATEDFSIEEISRLRTWLSNDGALDRHLFVLCNLDGTCPNLYSFLSSDYGITVTDNVVLETNAENYLIFNDGAYAPLTSVGSTELTANSAGKEVILPYTLQLELEHGSDEESATLTNHTIVSFDESAQLVEYADLAAGKDGTPTEADSYPITGLAYAKETTVYGDDQVVNTYVIVSGSYLYPAYSSLIQDNDLLTLEPLRTACPLGDTVVISGMSLTTPTLSFSVSEATAIRWMVYGLSLVLVVVAVVVFLKRRHL